MSLFYQYFFKFRIQHSYYTLGYGKDFKIVPLPRTEALIKRHKLICKERDNGFDIGSLMRDATTPFIDLGDEEILSFALILTKSESMTAPVAIVNFMQYFGWEWGKITASGVLVMLPVIVFAVFVRKYLVSGMLAGGVKE